MESNLEQTPAVKKSKKPILIIGIAAAVVALIVAGFFLYNPAANTYKTPIAIMQEQANDHAYKSDVDRAYRAINAFAKAEAEAIMEAVTQSEGYKNSLEEEQWFFDEAVGFNKKAYGDDYKIHYKIKNIEKLSEDDLNRYKETMVAYAEKLEAKLQDDSAFNRSLLAFAQKMKTAEVTEGYEMTLTQITTGSNLSEPEKQDKPATVYKVGGRWISEEALTSFVDFATWYANKI